jgi:hypothetical protein
MRIYFIVLSTIFLIFNISFAGRKYTLQRELQQQADEFSQTLSKLYNENAKNPAQAYKEANNLTILKHLLLIHYFKQQNIPTSEYLPLIEKVDCLIERNCNLR